MPSAQSILAGLALIATDAFAVAVVWHAVVLAACVALVSGWRPSQRLAAALLAAPLGSASAVAFLYQNAFNGSALGAIAVLLTTLSLTLPPQPVALGPKWATGLGLVMIVFGWTYPHFLHGASLFVYLAGAPLGLIPCPSLSLSIGFALLAGGFDVRGWPVALALAGLSYGLFGVAQLGVLVDATLIVGSVALMLVAMAPRRLRTDDAPVAASPGTHIG